MDYTRIYSTFIKSRRSSEACLLKSKVYTEKHHILPKTLGGSDLPENIISLTPEDHYFAHLLLAKIYGGSMWHAARSMANLQTGERDPSVFHRRAMFGHVRRNAAKVYSETMSGENSPMSDKREYTFTNARRDCVTGSRSKIMSNTGLSNRAISSLVRGDKKSYNGWWCLESNPSGKRGHSSGADLIACPDVHTLYHYDGRVWSGTKREFKKAFGRQLYFQSNSGHCAGWYRKKCDADAHYDTLKLKCSKNASVRGDVSGANNPRADQSVYAFENERTGEVVHKTRSQMASDYKLRRSAITAVVSGDQVAAGDWKLQGVERKRCRK